MQETINWRMDKHHIRKFELICKKHELSQSKLLSDIIQVVLANKKEFNYNSNRVIKALRIDDKLKEEIQDFAYQMDMGLSELIEKAILLFLSHLKKGT